MFVTEGGSLKSDVYGSGNYPLGGHFLVRYSYSTANKIAEYFDLTFEHSDLIYFSITFVDTLENHHLLKRNGFYLPNSLSFFDNNLVYETNVEYQGWSLSENECLTFKYVIVEFTYNNESLSCVIPFVSNYDFNLDIYEFDIFLIEN